MKQNVYEYVDSYFKLPMQELIYSGHFNSIPNHNMPTVDVDGCVHDAQGHLYPLLKPLCSKRPLGRHRHRRIKSQFSYKKKGLPSVCNVKLQAIIELHAKIHYPFHDSRVMLVWWHATFYLILIVMIWWHACKNLFWNLLIYLIVMTKMFVLHMPLF